MRLHVDTDQDAKWFKVVDMDTWEEIRHVLWADDVTGEYAQHRSDDNGRLVMIDGEIALDVKRGRIKLIDRRVEA